MLYAIIMKRIICVKEKIELSSLAKISGDLSFAATKIRQQ